MIIKGKVRFKVELFGEIEETMAITEKDYEIIKKEKVSMVPKKELEKVLREDLYYLGENLKIDIKELETSYKKVEKEINN